MAAYRSPKPLVGVRVPGGMPDFISKGLRFAVDSKEKFVCTGSVDKLVVLNSSTASETIRVYSLGDRNEQMESHVRRD